jgi:transposase
MSDSSTTQANRDWLRRERRAKKRLVRAQRSLDVVNANAAAIDLGSKEHYVAVPEDRDPSPVRCFGCFTPELRRMAAWLKACGITTVAMESTGVYWVPVYDLLEDEGFEVVLTDARRLNSVSGRKSDVHDCAWAQRLHSFGLLAAAFRPCRDIVILRSYWRERSARVEACSQQILLMQKALEQMNVQLHKAVSDITGVTGMSIIRAIVAGQHDPHILARMRQRGIRRSEAEIADALTGNYRKEHLFALKQALDAFDFFQKQLADCDREVEAYMQTLKGHERAMTATPQSEDRRPAKRRKNQPHFDLRAELTRVAGCDLTAIEGIDALTAQKVISECGVDMTRFPTDAHYASWMGLCPNNRKTGGVIRSRHTRRVNNRAANALRVAAQSLSHSNGPLGAYFRRLRARIGPAKAITATAHKLARLIYRMLKYGEQYVVQGQTNFEAQQKQRALKSLRTRASIMGFDLLDRASGELLTGEVS